MELQRLTAFAGLNGHSSLALTARFLPLAKAPTVSTLPAPTSPSDIDFRSAEVAFARRSAQRRLPGST